MVASSVVHDVVPVLSRQHDGHRQHGLADSRESKGCRLSCLVKEISIEELLSYQGIYEDV